MIHLIEALILASLAMSVYFYRRIPPSQRWVIPTYKPLTLPERLLRMTVVLVVAGIQIGLFLAALEHSDLHETLGLGRTYIRDDLLGIPALLGMLFWGQVVGYELRKFRKENA